MLTDGKEKRQFLHADDCAEALTILSENYTQTAGNEYHITNFEWTSIYTVACIVSSFFQDCKIIKGHLPDNLQNGYQFEPNDNILSFWQPKISLYEGIKKIVNNELLNS